MVDFDRFPLVREAFDLSGGRRESRRPDFDLPALLSDLVLDAREARLALDLPLDRELRLDLDVDVSAVVPFVTFVLNGTRRDAEKLE